MSKRIHQGSPIADVLKDFIDQNHLQKGIDNARVKELWIEVMGTGVNNYTENVYLQKNKLMVKLTSPVLREELSYGKSKIVDMMNEALGKTLISDVHLY